MANDSERIIGKRTAEIGGLKQKLAEEVEVGVNLRCQLEEQRAEYSALFQRKSMLDLIIEKDQERIIKLKADLAASQKRAEEAEARADELEKVDHQKIKNAGIAEYQQKVLMGLMTKARKESFDKGYLLGIQRCKRQVVRNFPEAKLDFSDWVVKSDDDDEDEGEEEEEAGDEDDIEILDGDQSIRGANDKSGEGSEPATKIDGVVGEQGDGAAQ